MVIVKPAKFQWVYSWFVRCRTRCTEVALIWLFARLRIRLDFTRIRIQPSKKNRILPSRKKNRIRIRPSRKKPDPTLEKQPGAGPYLILTLTFSFDIKFWKKSRCSDRIQIRPNFENWIRIHNPGYLYKLFAPVRI